MTQVALQSSDGFPTNTREPAQDILRDVKELDFTRNHRQKDFLEIPDNIYEALYGGGAYGGKTFLLTLLWIIKGAYKYRGAKGILFRREMTDLEKENIRLTHQYFPLTGGKYNDNKKSWYWPEYGSYFDFGHIQHLKDLASYDTLQYNMAIFEELTHFLEAMYLFIVGSRVRPSSSFNLAICRSGTNPGGIGQSFTYNRFVRPNEKGYTLIRDKKTTLTRIFIPALYQDNPYGMEYDPLYGNKLDILPEAERKAKKYGDWHAFEGSVFTSFRPIRFPGDPDNALHICPHFNIPEWWPRIVSVDWGKRAMCHALWAAISPDNRLYIYRERSWKGQDIPFWATEVGDCSRDEYVVLAILCGSAWQNRGNSTIAAEVKKYSKLNFISSQNNAGSRIETLQTAQEFLRFQQLERRPPTESYNHSKAEDIFRRLGEAALTNYVSQYKEFEPEINLPKLQILSAPDNTDISVAPVLVDTLPVAVYQKNNVEDIEEFDGDDPIDNFRYLCKFAQKFMTGQLGEELEKRKAMDAIISDYRNQDHESNTHDYYLRMARLEESGRESSFGVRRHSPRG